MQIQTAIFQTPNGPIEAVKLQWTGCSILLAAGTKGIAACPLLDITACQRFGVAAAVVESSPENPIGTLERLSLRKLTAVNENARKLGLREQMPVKDALAIIA
jgi:uncharacterized protein YunC (DUF1805 family)